MQYTSQNTRTNLMQNETTKRVLGGVRVHAR